ncbi:MAG: choice-of-anchor L domain-containing protein [Bacteroidota bacterium]
MQLKSSLFLILFLLVSGWALAQELDYTLTLLNTRLQAMPGVEVELVETTSRERLAARTDGRGQVLFQIRGGQIWQMNILEIRNYYKWQLVMPQGSGSRSQTITYYPKLFKWEMKPRQDRKALGVETVNQDYNASTRYTQPQSRVTLAVSDIDKSPLVDYPLRLTSPDLKKTFVAKTDAQGRAFYLVPAGYDYELDMEQVDGFKLVSVPKPGGQIRYSFTFAPYDIPETRRGDTIVQQLPEDISIGTSTHLLLDATFYEEGGGDLSHRTLHLIEMGSQEVYEFKTNDRGQAYLLLPIGKNYGFLQGKLKGQPIIRKVLDLTRDLYAPTYIRRNISVPQRASLKIPAGLDLTIPEEDPALSKFLDKQGLKLIRFQNLSPKGSSQNYLSFEDSQKRLGIGSGFLLSTGQIWNAFGPNNSNSKSTSHGPFEFSSLVPKALAYKEEGIYDPCILELEVKPKGNRLQLDYVFASEEYSEFNDFDDAFGIFITGPGFDPTVNQALSPDKSHRVSVTQINDSTHAALFQSNRDASQTRFQHWQYDGFTQKMGVSLPVKAGQAYTIKLVILDRRDSIYDSGVFVGLGSE